MPRGWDDPLPLHCTATILPATAEGLAGRALGFAEGLCDVERRLTADFVEDEVEVAHVIGLRLGTNHTQDIL